MTTYLRMKLKAALQIMILMFVCGNCQAQGITLIDLLDAPKVPTIELPTTNFAESAFSIEGFFATNFAQVERAGMMDLATRLRVVLATLREGEHPISRKSTSIRGFFQEFATKWNVAILVTDDLIMIIEPSDVKRFEHKVAILP